MSVEYRRSKFCPVTGRRSHTSKLLKTPVLDQGFSDIYGALIDTGDRLMTTVEYALGDTFTRSVTNKEDLKSQIRRASKRILRMVIKKTFYAEGIAKWQKTKSRVMNPIMIG